MRVDEDGNECPSTLGEYRDLCVSVGGADCQAVSFLDKKITESPKGRDSTVFVSDLQMRQLLFPMLVSGVPS